ncbi:MAG: DUF2612 domain-containing protein [Aeromonadaceae bacterium]
MISMREYAASPRIKQLISYHTEYFSASWVDDFYSVVWNVDTAQGFGLDIWGRIVGLENGRYLQIESGDYFGFNDAIDQSWQTFGSGTFYSGATETQTYELADPAFRTLILTKAMSNISDSTMPGLNKVLQELFPGRGRCWVNDLQNMAIRYVFEFNLEPWEISVIKSDSLPRPGGVLAAVLTAPADTFGFFEAGDSSQPFGQGTLLANGDLINVGI